MNSKQGSTPITIKHRSDDGTVMMLATWFEQTWAPHYGVDGPGDATADLRAALDETLPVILVGYNSANTPVGTVSLKESSISHHDLGPWVAAMLVDRAWRGQGVGVKLLQAITSEARQLGFDSLYISGGGKEMDVSDGELADAGWRSFDEAESLRGTVTVYRLRLTASDTT